MPVVTYIAVDRGELAPGNTAGTQYQLEVDFEGFPRRLMRKGELEETLSGEPEAWIHALQRQLAVQTTYVPLAARPNWREFFSSVLAGEVFQVDFTGTIASPGTAEDVFMVSAEVSEEQVGGVGVRYSFVVKRMP